ncbi:MAG TPA: helix-turn-helix transcriptional regulator [Actinospica sp.]|jgi:hypothetical protein|nr:helix-turn-helix transcriptional regulator [Actinospica sp.]
MARAKTSISEIARIAAARKACADGTFEAVITENMLSMADVADALQIHNSNVYRWMRGTTRPGRAMALRIADFLDGLPGELQASRRR